MIDLQTTIEHRPVEEKVQTARALLFQVWIDLNFGNAPTDWWWNTPPKPLSQALDEAAECRKLEWVCVVLPEGENPRTDGRWDNP